MAFTISSVISLGLPLVLLVALSAYTTSALSFGTTKGSDCARCFIERDPASCILCETYVKENLASSAELDDSDNILTDKRAPGYIRKMRRTNCSCCIMTRHSMNYCCLRCLQSSRDK